MDTGKSEIEFVDNYIETMDEGNEEQVNFICSYIDNCIEKKNKILKFTRQMLEETKEENDIILYTNIIVIFSDTIKQLAAIKEEIKEIYEFKKEYDSSCLDIETKLQNLENK